MLNAAFKENMYFALSDEKFMSRTSWGLCHVGKEYLYSEALNKRRKTDQSLSKKVENSFSRLFL